MMTRLALLALSTLLMTSLAACSVGDDDGDATATTSAPIQASATSAPATTATAEQPAAPTATTAAPTEAASPEGSPSASPAGFTDEEAALLDLLLAAGDLPGEWTQLRAEAPTDSDGPGICGADRFPQADERIAEVEVEYQSEDGARFVLQNLTEFPVEVAEAAMDYIRETATCDEWTDETGTVFEIEEAAAPDLGDDSHALRVTFQVADAGTLAGDFVFVRVGGLVTIVTTLALGERDTEELGEVATLAVAKLQAGRAAALTEDEVELIERLLDLDDMPSDWNQIQAAHRSDPENWTGLCESDLFDDADQATARVAIELYEGFDEDSASLLQLLISYPAGVALDAFDHEREAASCDDFPGGDDEIELEPETTFPALGDDSFAVRFTYENDDRNIEGLWIVILAGDRLSTLIFTDPDDLDAGDVEEVAQMAAEKMAGVD